MLGDSVSSPKMITAENTPASDSNTLIEVAGWAAILCLLVAYGLVTAKIVTPESIAFQLLNLAGAVGLGAISWKKRVYQGVVLNIVWGLVGIVAIALHIF